MDPRQRLTQGEWLGATEAARLLGVSRWTIMRWMRTGQLNYRRRPLSGQRQCDPQALQALLQDKP